MKITKLYLKYQITLSNILIFLLLIIFLTISYYITIYNINESLSYEEVLLYYFENNFYYTKIVIVFVSCFLFMKLKNERNEYLVNIIAPAGYNKKENYSSMIMSNIIILVSIILILLCNFVIIGVINKNYFTIKLTYLIGFLNLVLLAIHYGLLTYLLILITNNQFIYILVIIMFLLSDLLINTNEFIKYIYLCFFPNIINNTGLFYINILYVIINIVFLYLFDKSIYINRDLRN